MSAAVDASAVGDASRAARLKRRRAPSSGFSKTAPPSTSPLASTPACLRRLRPDASRRHACSVLAVLPGLDGFLRQRIRGLVASRSRPWGSSGFRAPGPHACDHLRASSPMPALQSFSLPRSVPRVTAGSCPPAVRRRRRPGYEALFRSGIRDDAGPFPVHAARCSPGLPRLEPHMRACSPRLRGDTAGSSHHPKAMCRRSGHRVMRPVRRPARSEDRVQPEGCTHDATPGVGRAGESRVANDTSGGTSPSRPAWSSDVCTRTEVRASPSCRPTHGPCVTPSCAAPCAEAGSDDTPPKRHTLSPSAPSHHRPHHGPEGQDAPRPQRTRRSAGRLAVACAGGVVRASLRRPGWDGQVSGPAHRRGGG